MNRSIVLSLFLVFIFSSVLFGEDNSGEAVTTAKERRAQRTREILQRSQKRKYEKYNGRDVTIRFYMNPGELPDEYELVTVQTVGAVIKLDFEDVDESAIIVVAGEDQADEIVKKEFERSIYSDYYRRGLQIKLPTRAKVDYKWVFRDATGGALSDVNVEIYLCSNTSGKGNKVFFGEQQSDDNGRVEIRGANGGFRMVSLVLSHPDNFGSVKIIPPIQSKSRRKDDRLTDIDLPWVSQESEGYTRSINGVVIDDANNPIAGAVLNCAFASTPGSVALYPKDGWGYKVYTDEDGRFSMYLPKEKGEKRVGEYIPRNTKYLVRIDAPKEYEIVPYAGWLNNVEDHVIKMDNHGYYRRFVFEDENGPITDESRLKKIYFSTNRYSDESLQYHYKDWKDGGNFPLGRYYATMNTKSYNLEFLPLEVTKDSPEELVFRFGGVITYCGQVVDGITGEPIEGALVVDSASFNRKTEAERELETLPIHFLQDVNYVASLKKDCEFDTFTQTDPNGKFEIKKSPDKTVYWYTIFKENYLEVECSTQVTKADSNNRAAFSVVPLFPSAKVSIKVSHQGKKVTMKPHWIIEWDEQPEWVGSPFKMYSNESIYEKTETFEYDVNTMQADSGGSYESGFGANIILWYLLYDYLTTPRVSVYGIPIVFRRSYPPTYIEHGIESDSNDVVEWIEQEQGFDEDEDETIPTFYEIFTGSFYKFDEYRTIRSDRVQTVCVPAGFKLKLKLVLSNDPELKWRSYTSPEIKLEKGETKDLGTVQLKAASHIFVKVVDSSGEGVGDISVEHWLDGYGRMLVRPTDEDGIVRFHCWPGYNGKFVVSTEKGNYYMKRPKKDSKGSIESISYKMGEADEAGREITFVISEELISRLK